MKGAIDERLRRTDIFIFGGVIDHPAPLSVGVVGDSVVIVSGLDDPLAPSADDVIEADEETWRQLLFVRESASSSRSRSAVMPIRRPIRGRSSATPGEGNGVFGSRLDDTCQDGAGEAVPRWPPVHA